jgi:peptide/nickel transport system ATP-binding protein
VSAADDARTPLLDVRDLRVSFHTESGRVPAVDGVDFTLAAGEILGVVGESGSGKSVTMLSVLRLLDERNSEIEGQVLYRGRDILGLSKRELRSVRGEEISMIFQDPMTSLNPLYPVGWQIVEQIRTHRGVSKAAARAQAVDLLRSVGIPEPERRVDEYPHQFSGGMRQRVMIAMALSCRPRILIADEPTTALDVTIQAQILDLIRTLRHELSSAVILITHDLGVVAEIADRVLVMYAGRIVEHGTTRQILADPQHPYTWGLLGSIPRIDRPRRARLRAIAGAPASSAEIAGGCGFAPRCPHRFERCSQTPPLRDPRGDGHSDACHLPAETRPALRRRSTEDEAVGS